MNRLPTTIFDLNGQLALIRRAYSGAISVYRCHAERIGSSVTYQPSKSRIGRFDDAAQLTTALIERFKLSRFDEELKAVERLGEAAKQCGAFEVPAAPPAKLSPVSRVTWTVAEGTTPYMCERLAARLKDEAALAGYDVLNIEVVPAGPGKPTGLEARKAATFCYATTIEMCRIAAKCKGTKQ